MTAKKILILFIYIILIFSILIIGFFLKEERFAPNLDSINLYPSFTHLFGTDYLGRDMFFRTIKGLYLSLFIGIVSSLLSIFISLFFGITAAAFGKFADALANWIIDLFLGLPHLVALILISFALGGGFKGVIIGIALTHWTSLARVIRAEIIKLNSSNFIAISKNFGHTNLWIALKHMTLHIIPQLLIAFVLTFSNAILHEASITFLGFGLPPHKPSIGAIFSESIKYISSGIWWLALLPGVLFVIVVLIIYKIGRSLKRIIE